MRKQKIDIYAIPGWGFSADIFNLLNSDECNVIGLNYFNVTLTSLQFIAGYLANKLPDHAVLLGWSFGGLIAVEIAALFPNKVSKLILISSSPKLLADHDWMGIKPNEAADFAAGLMQHPADQMNTFMRLVSHPCRLIAFKQVLHSYLFSQPVASLAALLTILFAADLREKYQNIKTDILYIVNRQDKLIPQDITQVKQLKPSVNIVEFNNTGHAGFLTEQVKYIAAIRDFLKNESSD